MTTKEYLSQIKDMRDRIKEKQAQIDNLRSLLTSISVNTENERVSSSSDPDKIGKMISDILDREAELKVYVDEYLQKEKEITHQIDSMKNPKCRAILYWRYVACMTFENIAANAMELSFMHTFRLHGQALIEFEKEFGEFYK